MGLIGSAPDDPLFGYNPGLNETDGRYLYYVTDGQGRRYVVADTQGISRTSAIGYYGSGSNHGGKYAGGTTNASSFGATRNPNEIGLRQLSAFRNRFYDQQTGRWTQEDPIGVAGGLNLYGYVGNNPVAFMDPFGLCPLKETGVPCTVTFAAGGAAAGFGVGVTASVAAAVPTAGGSILFSPATITATTTTGFLGGALIGLAKDISDNAKPIANAAASVWQKLKDFVATAVGTIAGDQTPAQRRRPRPEDAPPPPPAHAPDPAHPKPELPVRNER
jgi:RHS repeat-associated protein